MLHRFPSPTLRFASSITAALWRSTVESERFEALLVTGPDKHLLRLRPPIIDWGVIVIFGTISIDISAKDREIAVRSLPSIRLDLKCKRIS